ncbi:MAG: hypothetical protein GY835_19655 [bacterium]|nr:hypothetical protein [bacterium]
MHGIDINRAKHGGSPSVSDLIRDAIAMEMAELWASIYDAVYTQIKADIDDSSTYSDAALNRTTYPTLASQENSTDTQVTLAIMRTHSNAVRLNKLCGPKSGYTWVMQENCYEAFEPAAAALHVWNINGKANNSVDAGYQEIGTFEGQGVATPQGMTVGDIFYTRRQDVKIHTHYPLTIRQVASGRNSAKFVIETGINGYVINPGFQGKMTSKD